MQLPIVIDFETYFCSKTYTLRKSTTEEYIRDPRFQAHLVGIHDLDTRQQSFMCGRYVADFLSSLELHKRAVICHHANFDLLILNHHFGIRPKFIFDTMPMGRLVHGPLQSVSLANLARLYGLPEKSVPYHLFDGLRTEQISPQTMQELGVGCVHDCELTGEIFLRMIGQVPQFELPLIDKTVRQFTEPALIADVPMLEKLAADEHERKQNLIRDLAVSPKDISGNKKFLRLLEIEGVEIEYKPGKPNKNGTPRHIPCFAKTDEFMQGLVESEFPRVRALAEARLGHKSTIQETRAARIAEMGKRGAVCVYLNFAGAHTLRHSGGDKTNLQNLPRGSLLRKSLVSPEGWLISVLDFRQIELRTCLWLAGYQYWLDFLADGGNLYIEMASDIFGFPVNKQDNFAEYHVGKETTLGCTYGMGATKHTKYINGKNVAGVRIDSDLSERCVSGFRDKFPAVVSLWRECNSLLPMILDGKEFEWKCFHFKDRKAYLPTGSYMHFGQLGYGMIHEEDAKPDWYMLTRKGTKKRFYGAHLLENLNQFLARCVAFSKKAQVNKKLVLSTHDELVHLIRARGEHEEIAEICQAPIGWMPGLPIEVEGGVYDRYEK